MKSRIKTGILKAARAGLFTILALTAGSARAAVPELINFQGKLTDSAGTAITTSVPMVFKFYTTATGGSLVWTENQAVLPDDTGLYSVLLGSATSFSTYGISFSTSYWLGVTVGTDQEMTPRYKIVSSAYALYSINSGTAAYSVNSGTAAWANGVDWPMINHKPVFAAGDVYLASTQTFTGSNIFTGPGTFLSTAAFTAQNAFAPGITISSGLVVAAGNVGFGTTTPASTLTVVGTFMLVNGSQAAGNVLTSDTNGLASWQAPGVGGDVYKASTQTFTGSNTFLSTAVFTALNASLPGVTISSGLVVSAGNVGIGTMMAPSNLTVIGTFLLADGSAAAGRVLTSDANGLASWQVAGVGGDVYKASTQTFTGVNTFMGNTYFSSSAYFTNGGIYSTGTAGGTALAGAGTRFMWMPEKKAIRAGGIDGTQWNSGSVGDYSAAFGFNNTASGLKSIAAGGEYNTAGNQAATVSGGLFNAASGQYSTVAGGAQSTASGQYSAVAGGSQNTASGIYAIVAGGSTNSAGDRAAVSGGENNRASGTYAAIAGGNLNTASAYAAAVSGGQGNTASNTYATVAGGDGNTANGAYSFAAGRASSSAVEGTFTWADSDGTQVDNDVFNRTWFKNRGGFLVTASTDPADGGLFLNSDNYLGVGTIVPTSTLTVVGTFKLADGTQGAGKVLTSDAAGLAAWAAPAGPVYAVTQTDNTNATPTLTNGSILSIALLANATYQFEAELSCGVNNSATGLQYAVAYPAAGASVEAVIYGPISSAAMKNSRITAINTASPNYFTETFLTGGILIKGIISTTSAGNLTIQHAASNPGTSTVYKYSYLKVTKI